MSPITLPTHSAPFGDEHLRAFGFGLVGAHRTGKTVLAKKIAELNEIPFVQTSLSKLATDMGLKIGLDMPFRDRQAFQEKALQGFIEAYENVGQGTTFVTDRTPIDLAAYVITAWHPSVASPALTVWADDYVARCVEATNRWFWQLAVIQPTPAIPFVAEDQKGESTPFYREALNTTMIGLAWSDEVKPAVDVIPRAMHKLSERLERATYEFSVNISDYATALRESGSVH